VLSDEARAGLPDKRRREDASGQLLIRRPPSPTVYDRLAACGASRGAAALIRGMRDLG